MNPDMPAGQKSEIILNSMSDNSYCPNKKLAYSIWKEHIKPHAGITPPDDSPIDVDFIELVLDARMMARSMFVLGGRSAEEAAQVRLRAQYCEAFMICTTINAFYPYFQFQPVAGLVQYHWHSKKNNAPIYTTVGSRIYNPERGIVPVIWCESALCSWGMTQEQEDRDKIGDDVLVDLDELMHTYGTQDIEQDGTILIATGEASNKAYSKPIVLDTVMYDVLSSKQIIDAQGGVAMEAPELTINPVYRGLCLTPQYYANGAATMHLANSYPVDLITTVANQIVDSRKESQRKNKELYK